MFRSVADRQICDRYEVLVPIVFLQVYRADYKSDKAKFWSRLKNDLVAGLTVGVMVIPQAMSYATVAGLEPVYGLYNAFVGILLYPLFGTSPQLVTGPTAVMSIMVGAAVPATVGGVAVSQNLHEYMSFVLAFFAVRESIDTASRPPTTQMHPRAIECRVACASHDMCTNCTMTANATSCPVRKTPTADTEQRDHRLINASTPQLLDCSAPPVPALLYPRSCTCVLAQGLWQLILGVADLGFLVNLVSEPVITGFTSAAAFLIASTQFATLLGITKCHAPDGGSCNLAQACTHVVDQADTIQLATPLCSLLSVSMLLFFKFKVKTWKSKLSFLGSFGPLFLVIIVM